MPKPKGLLTLPDWMIKQVNDKDKLDQIEKKPSKNLFNNKKPFQNTLFEAGKLKKPEGETKFTGELDVLDKSEDIDLPLDNFINLYECGFQCEIILNLANSSVELILGLELDWPSQFKAVLSKTATFHICYGQNLCSFIDVVSINKLPLAFTHLLQHPCVKLVGHNIINDLNKIARDFNFDTKVIIEKKVLKKPPADLILFCDHGWNFQCNEEMETPINPTTDENLQLKFNGKIHYSINFAECASYCEQLLSLANSSDELILGFDQEWPMTKYGCGKVALMQICPNENECYIFHLTGITSLPKVLLLLLRHNKVKLTGLNIKNDIRKLGKDFKVDVYSILKNNTIELSSLANQILHCYERWSLHRIVLNQLGLILDKDPKVRISRWDDKNLSEAQLMYAATDAYASLLCYQHLDRLRRRNLNNENH